MSYVTIEWCDSRTHTHTYIPTNTQTHTDTETLVRIHMWRQCVSMQTRRNIYFSLCVLTFAKNKIIIELLCECIFECPWTQGQPHRERNLIRFDWDVVCGRCCCLCCVYVWVSVIDASNTETRLPYTHTHVWASATSELRSVSHEYALFWFSYKQDSQLDEPPKIL